MAINFSSVLGRSAKFQPRWTRGQHSRGRARGDTPNPKEPRHAAAASLWQALRNTHAFTLGAPISPLLLSVSPHNHVQAISVQARASR